ncbi:MAG TPA: glycosyltransferase family 1 protein [Gemmatimonadetes bacterium]|nr:glycosyltransferase family 1 protein [Gemmatimonadota bacterium]
MRILIYSMEHPATRGGLNAVVENLGRDLSKRGHEVLRVWPEDGRGFEPPANTGVRYLPMKVEALDLSRLVLPAYLRRAKAMRQRLADLILRERIDVVNTHFLDNTAAYFLSAARKAGVCGIASIQGSDVHSASDSVLKRGRLHALGRLADAITLATEKMRYHFYAGSSVASRLQVINNGVSIEKWHSSHSRGQAAHEGLRIVGVGALRVVKGFDLAIRAVAHLVHDRGMDDVTFTIAGEGSERGALEQLARESGVKEHVEFAGYKAQPELAELYAKSNMLLMTSRAEGGPATLIEAMAHGLYVLATDVGYAPESVGLYGYGAVVDSFDPAQIAEAIAEARPVLGESAPRNMDVLNAFSWVRTVDQYEALMLSCADQKRKSYAR